MKIIAKSYSNYAAAIEASKLVFGVVNLTAINKLYVMLPAAYGSGASFILKWNGHKLKFGYHVNGTVYLYEY